MNLSAAAAVVLLEELERPLAFRDASKEKLEWCDKYFDVLVKEVKSKWRDGGGNQGELFLIDVQLCKKLMRIRFLISLILVGSLNLDLQMRAVSAIVSVLYNRPTSDVEQVVLFSFMDLMNQVLTDHIFEG